MALRVLARTSPASMGCFLGVIAIAQRNGGALGFGHADTELPNSDDDDLAADRYRHYMYGGNGINQQTE